MRRCGVIAATLVLVAAASAAGPATGATTLVVTGHGWGHGVGMSQWGAYGYARHGWSWQRILAHYYPGTRLSAAPVTNVRVLLAASQPRVSVSCPAPLTVGDATGRTYPLHAGTYTVNAKLLLPVGRRHVRVRGSRRHAHDEPVATVRVERALRSPLVFDCASAPLEWKGGAYHGRLVVRSGGGRLSVVDSLPLDEYVAGVVGGEMPDRWSMAALEAQAVASRSYALATLHPTRHFDLFSDTRSQVYGGIAYETPRTDLAVQRTAGRVLTYHGTVATTYFSSSSGGRTADVSEVWPALGDVPYLRSVPDPYDWGPHHSWQVVLPASELPELASLKLVRASDGRVTSVVDGTERLSGAQFRKQLGLQSTWFDIDALTLDAARPQVRYGGKVQLHASVKGLAGVALQRRVGAGRWTTLKHVRGSASVAVEPRANTTYRLQAARVAGPEVTVAVAPKLVVTPAGQNVLAGAVEPATRAPVTVWLLAHGAWRVVAHPGIDASGTFRAPLRLHAGTYRVQVDEDGRFAAATATVRVASRLLASLGY